MMNLVKASESWLDVVSGDLKKTRLKNVAEINARALSATTDDDFALRYLEISNVYNRGIISEAAIEELAFIDAPSRAKRIVQHGDTVISSVRPNLQAVAHIDQASDNFIASTGFYVVSPNQTKLHPKYTYYLLLSENTKQYLEAVAKGVGYPAVDDKDFVTTKLLLPSVPEQRRIAAYLDKTCAAIDTAIEKKQKQLETLDALRKSIIHKAVTRGLDDSVELKDSGVEWMGKLPKHWKVDKLKYVTSLIVDGTHVTPTYMPEGVPFLRVTDIQDEEIDLARVKYIAEEEHQLLCKRAKAEYGDILLSKNGTIGLVKIVHWDWEFSFFVSLCLLRPLKKLNPYYFSYYFESALVEQQLFESCKRTSVTNLHLVKIRELLIALPPVEGQKEIVLYLNEKLAHLNRLKLNIVAQIEALSNYRKSLIHECVTGKRRITEADVAQVIDDKKQ